MPRQKTQRPAAVASADRDDARTDDGLLLVPSGVGVLSEHVLL